MQSGVWGTMGTQGQTQQRWTDVINEDWSAEKGQVLTLQQLKNKVASLKRSATRAIKCELSALAA